MNNKIRNSIVFLLLRTPVYVLLVILYFNMIKCYLNNLKFFPEKINNSISWIIIVVFIGVLAYLIYISYSYYKNRISEGTITSKNFCVIYKNDEDIEMNFLNSYIFPIIAGFQEINFIWVIFYEILIYIIISKNINKYYRLFISIFFTEYIAYENENGNEYKFFSREKEETIKQYLDNNKKIPLKNVDFSLDSLGKNILIFKK